MKIAKKLSLLTTIATLGVIITSCSANKVAQCNQLVAVANQAATYGREFGEKVPDFEKEGSKGFTEAADKFDQFTAQLEMVKLEDEKLKGYQAEFATMYKAVSQGLRDGAEAVDKKDAEALQAAGKLLQESAAPEEKLVKEVNSYCSGQ